MKLAIVGKGNVARALLPLLAEDERFEIAGTHSRSEPAADSVPEFLDRVGADVLIELTSLEPRSGQAAIGHIEAAFARGMHVVTANKGPIAHSYRELAAQAAHFGVLFRFESTVMDGTPVFSLFRNTMPGVQVLGFEGVLNSTTNVVLEAMENGKSLSEGVAEAQRMGIAEADPSFDLDGWDSAVKAAAIANVLMDAAVTPESVERRGITENDAEDALLASVNHRRLRLVSRGQSTGDGWKLTVGPEALHLGDPLAIASGTSNALYFHTDKMGTFGIVSVQPGVAQTAFGIYSDLVDVATRC